MKFIKLTNGGVAVCDDGDEWIVRKHKWLRIDQKAVSYARKTTNQKPVAMHRYIAEEYLKTKLTSSVVVHHANGNGLDNRKSNLRLVFRYAHSMGHKAGDPGESMGEPLIPGKTNSHDE